MIGIFPSIQEAGASRLDHHSKERQEHHSHDLFLPLNDSMLDDVSCLAQTIPADMDMTISDYVKGLSVASQPMYV
jgi:hypothetical protein